MFCLFVFQESSLLKFIIMWSTSHVLGISLGTVTILLSAFLNSIPTLIEPYPCDLGFLVPVKCFRIICPHDAVLYLSILTGLKLYFTSCFKNITLVFLRPRGLPSYVWIYAWMCGYRIVSFSPFSFVQSLYVHVFLTEILMHRHTPRHTWNMPCIVWGHHIEAKVPLSCPCTCTHMSPSLWCHQRAIWSVRMHTYILEKFHGFQSYISDGPTHCLLSRNLGMVCWASLVSL